MSVTFLRSSVEASDIPQDKRPHIAIMGRSNVGKSSLINHLANSKDIARTSSKPGLTQTANFYDFDGKFLLVDLPGYGFARGNKSKRAGLSQIISDYLSEAEDLRLILLVIDGRHGFTDSDLYALKELRKAKLPITVIFNKIDKLKKSALLSTINKFGQNYPDVEMIPHSIDDNKTLIPIREAIRGGLKD